MLDNITKFIEVFRFFSIKSSDVSELSCVPCCFSRLHRIGLPPPLELYRSVSSAMEDVRAGLNINRKLKELK